jgi:hypothetical protein
MSDFGGMSDLVDQIKDASASTAQSDTAFNTRLDGFEKSLNELYLKTCRPGFGGDRDNASFERKEAIGVLQVAARDHRQQGGRG